MYCRVRAGLF